MRSRKGPTMIIPLIVLLLSLSTIGGGFLRSVRADTTVTGTVFCDRCRDGQRSFFDFPLSGAKVGVTCSDGGPEYREDTTNWMGSYTVRYEGSLDLTGCVARVASGLPDCDGSAGPSQPLTLMFRMFDMAMYVVVPLLSQPEETIGFCPQPSPTLPPPPPPTPTPPPPPLLLAPAMPGAPALPRTRPWPWPPAPPFRWSFPIAATTACSYDKWMMPEYGCYWRVVRPETRVGIAFGAIAARRYGMEMTLWEGLQGRGDLYRALLREATTSLLNSYHSLGFFYPPLGVVVHMNQALLGSPRDAIMMALRFRRANSGAPGLGNSTTCNFTHC